MTRSPEINELAKALAQAQAAIKGAKKDTDNSYFKSKYADLASVWDACRDALTKNGLSVVQSPHLIGAADTGFVVEVETLLLHSSGQWVCDTIGVPVGKPDAQGVGSATTYARRYALSAFTGVAPEDDDGNAAVATNGHAKAEPVVKPKGFDQWQLDMKAAADLGMAALQGAWKNSGTGMRAYATQHEAAWWEKCKERAAEIKEVTA